jgi:hypothetical protein
VGEEYSEEVCRPVIEQGVWRIRTNLEPTELYRTPSHVPDIKRKRLGWVERVIEMDQTRVAKSVFER